MRVHPSHVLEAHARQSDQVVDDPQDQLAHDGQVPLEQEIVVAVDAPRQSVFDGDDRPGCATLHHSVEGHLKRRTG